MKNILSAFLFNIICILLFGILYPSFIIALGFFVPDASEGFPINYKNQTIGYFNIGQKFDKPQYFWSRPSAVDYNAAATGGSNFGNYNPDHLKNVKERLNNFLKHHPYLAKNEIPVEMLTSSGGGLDPHISPQSAKVQVERIAKIRKIDKNKIYQLVNNYTENPFFSIFGTSKVNVLQINIALDKLSK